jgi:hypothetical protein
LRRLRPNRDRSTGQQSNNTEGPTEETVLKH